VRGKKKQDDPLAFVADSSPAIASAISASLEGEEAQRLAEHWDAYWRLHAHPGQVPPEGDWLVWLVMGGRGFGKTRAGAEWVRTIVEQDPFARIALVGASLGEVRSVMVEGESGIIACSPPGTRPVFEPSLGRLRWPNGAQAFCYSAAEPEALRGPQHSHAPGSGAKGISAQRNSCPAGFPPASTCVRSDICSACSPGKRGRVAGWP
jgi:hypothetical protein